MNTDIYYVYILYFIFYDESKGKMIHLIIVNTCKKIIEVGRLLVETIFNQDNILTFVNNN